MPISHCDCYTGGIGKEGNSPVFPVFQLLPSWGLGAEARATAVILCATTLLALRSESLLTSQALQHFTLQVSSTVLSCFTLASM